MTRSSIAAPAFVGPVFVVGLPRSGTKLLRDLLNRNPRVSIPEIETHFVPYLLRKFGSPSPLHDARQLKRFGDEVRLSTFYGHMRQRGFVLDLEDFAARADLDSWSSVFETLLRHFGPKPPSRTVVFGDKTPDYLKAMQLLRSTFPASRFVHITRDPRDVALSARKAWGQHPYRTAQRWQVALTRHRRVGKRIGGYLEVRYEDLLTDPQATLGAVCRFLDCDFSSDMLMLDHSNEDFGDAKGSTSIVSENTNKFWGGFSEKEIRRIEGIAYDQMRDLGYPIYFAKGPNSLGEGMELILRGSDLFAITRTKMRRIGVGAGARYILSRRRRRI